MFNYLFKKNTKSYILEKHEKTSQEKISNFDEVIKILKDKKFTSLIKFGNWPVKTEATGKVNPFIEFK